MSAYYWILFALLIYFSGYLLVMGWAGLITQTSMVHRCPYTFHRPTIYLLILSLLFLDSILARFGETAALVIFCLLALDFVYETLHPFFAAFVEITSASKEAIESDLIDAFEKLDLTYEGTYPKYRLPEQGAKLKVKHWSKLGKGEIFIYPRSKMDLLLRIAEIIEEDFERDEGRYEVRGYLANIFAAFFILAITLWQYVSRFCPGS